MRGLRTDSPAAGGQCSQSFHICISTVAILQNQNAATSFSSIPLGFGVRFPLRLLVSQVHVDAYVEKLSCVHVCVPPWFKNKNKK